MSIDYPVNKLCLLFTIFHGNWFFSKLAWIWISIILNVHILIDICKTLSSVLDWMLAGFCQICSIDYTADCNKFQVKANTLILYLFIWARPSSGRYLQVLCCEAEKGVHRISCGCHRNNPFPWQPGIRHPWGIPA